MHFFFPHAWCIYIMQFYLSVFEKKPENLTGLKDTDL